MVELKGFHFIEIEIVFFQFLTIDIDYHWIDYDYHWLEKIQFHHIRKIEGEILNFNFKLWTLNLIISFKFKV